MDDNITENIKRMGNELKHMHRMGEIVDIIKHRINWEHSREMFSSNTEERIICKAKINVYTDILDIIQKEMLMDLPYDEMTMVENQIKKTRDDLVDEIIDMDDFRNSHDYSKMFRLKRKLASILESIVFYYFEIGYLHGKGENIKDV